MWGLYRLFLFILTSLLILDTAISIHLPRPSPVFKRIKRSTLWHLVDIWNCFHSLKEMPRVLRRVFVKIFLFCNLYILNSATNTPPTHTQVTKAVTRYKREISIKLMNIILQCFNFSNWGNIKQWTIKNLNFAETENCQFYFFQQTVICHIPLSADGDSL